MKLELSRQEILALYKDSMSNNRYADDSIIIFSRKLLEEAAKVCDSVAHGVHEAEVGQCASHIRKLIKYHGKNTIDTRTNNKNVTLLQVNFRGGEFPAYIHKGVIYENRDDEPIHWAIKDWEEISTAKHAKLCKKWGLA